MSDREEVVALEVSFDMRAAENREERDVRTMIRQEELFAQAARVAFRELVEVMGRVQDSFDEMTLAMLRGRGGRRLRVIKKQTRRRVRERARRRRVEAQPSFTGKRR